MMMMMINIEALCVLYSGTFDRVDGHHNRVFAGVFHPSDPNLFITGGWDSTVHFWDCRVNTSIRFVLQFRVKTVLLCTLHQTGMFTALDVVCALTKTIDVFFTFLTFF